jgi:hypothetical protein
MAGFSYLKKDSKEDNAINSTGTNVTEAIMIFLPILESNSANYIMRQNLQFHIAESELI